jgi:hypothetical protein
LKQLISDIQSNQNLQTLDEARQAPVQHTSWTRLSSAAPELTNAALSHGRMDLLAFAACTSNYPNQPRESTLNAIHH